MSAREVTLTAERISLQQHSRSNGVDSAALEVTRQVIVKIIEQQKITKTTSGRRKYIRRDT